VADSNPKMLTPVRPLSFTPSPVSSQSSIVSPASATVNYPDYLKPTKSIIVGGGQPIVVPGTTKPATTTTSGADKSSLLYNKSSNSSSGSIATTNSEKVEHKSINQSVLLSKSSSIDSKIDNVDEFCPEGGSGLDRTFLEDAINAFESTAAGQAAPGDSDR
jgi:hypothetical protein